MRGYACLMSSNAWGISSLVIALDGAWGGSLELSLSFGGRRHLVASTRALIVGVCEEQLEPADCAQVAMVAQELLENLAKYSDGARARLSFALSVDAQRAEARIATSNAATPAHLARAEQLLRRMIEAPDPSDSYQQLVAACGEREGSGLGLARIRAEAGMELAFSISRQVLEIVVTGAVQPKRSGA